MARVAPAAGATSLHYGRGMATEARYDAIADWYEEYSGPHAGARDDDGTLLAELLGPGDGTLLEVCCGSGGRTEAIRGLGWRPVGMDISANLLRYAATRLPVARADAVALPVASGSVDAAVAIRCHTDVDDYPAVLRETTRVLAPGGRLVHIGLHPCFCGAFADRSNPDEGPVLHPGYRRTDRRFEAWSPAGVRARVGATHLPLDTLLTAFLDAGLAITGVREAGPDAYPYLLGIGARKPGAGQ